MKRISTLLLAIMLLFVLSSCSFNNNPVLDEQLSPEKDDSFLSKEKDSVDSNDDRCEKDNHSKTEIYLPDSDSSVVESKSPIDDQSSSISNNPNHTIVSNGNTYEVYSNIGAIDISWIAGDCDIQGYNGNNMVVKEDLNSVEATPLAAFIDDSTLYLKFNMSANGNVPQKNIQILVPTAWRLNEISFDGMSGDLSVKEVQVKNVSANTMSGNVVVNDSTISSGVSLNTMSGDVEVKLSSYIGNISANSMSGDVEVDASNASWVKIETMSGDLAAKFDSCPATLIAKTTSGDITLNMPQDLSCKITYNIIENGSFQCYPEHTRVNDGTVICGTGKSSVNVTTNKGNVLVTNSSFGNNNANGGNSNHNGGTGSSNTTIEKWDATAFNTFNMYAVNANQHAVQAKMYLTLSDDNYVDGLRALGEISDAAATLKTLKDFISKKEALVIDDEGKTLLDWVDETYNMACDLSKTELSDDGYSLQRVDLLMNMSKFLVYCEALTQV